MRTFWPDKSASRGYSDHQPHRTPMVMPCRCELTGRLVDPYGYSHSHCTTGQHPQIGPPILQHIKLISRATSGAHQALYWSTVAVITLATLSAWSHVYHDANKTNLADIQVTSPPCRDVSITKPSLSVDAKAGTSQKGLNSSWTHPQVVVEYEELPWVRTDLGLVGVRNRIRDGADFPRVYLSGNSVW